MAFSNGDLVSAVLEANQQTATSTEVIDKGNAKSVDVLLGKGRRIYDAPDKGILWGWEVSAYVWTKAISAGAFLIPFLAWAFGWAEVNTTAMWLGIGTGILFLAITGLLLVKDLDRPDRFLNVLFRPQWSSWLVKGAYAITAYGGLLTLLGLATWLDWSIMISPLMWATGVIAIIVAIYTAFLFAQAKGRDFWQSPTLSIHMLLHSFMAGAAAFGIIALFVESGANWLPFLKTTLMVCLGINLATMLIELTTTHPTEDAKRTVDMILKGRYKSMFWAGVILLGNLIPLAILSFGASSAMIIAIAGVMVLIGIYITEHIWVEAPQRLPLS